MAKLGKYRLEALLRVKYRERRRAEFELAQALRALKDAEKKLEELEEEKEELITAWNDEQEAMRVAMDGGGRIGDGTTHVNFLRKLKEEREAKEEEIEAQEEEVERCREKVQRRRRDYVRAAQEHQTMEKHKELWEKKRRAELSREEAKNFDELASTIHHLQNWRDEGGHGS